MATIKEQCPNISWGDLRIIIALLRFKYGVSGEEMSEVRKIRMKIRQRVVYLFVFFKCKINK